ncbi:monofunctional biosynthetic peptidoglycan transglycosylase [Vibrio japonicus]|uniref:Biosynthetic peptidoglycan transglycosylase n=1 Tax=Vibrio japonicus TaxID=1824638 RepID=A0ABY5LPS8_9VIBR|nr:monofunctional biosynthetic peptidoglycan transglycosylase [Vibrio japonicus]UUM33145.1 monofunctional biosynthetic peptidoglycan transglycosylase [Vibrio japonicus]
MTVFALAFGVPIVLVFILKFVNPPFWGWEISRTFFPPKGYPEQSQHQWVPLSEISPSLPLAVMASEDQRFPHHWGIDVNALASVIKNSGQEGPNRGASTITQQTAKNVFLFPSRTYIRKAYELYITLLIELMWGKERIMEMYLNVVEFGPGIYGVQAASEHYFGVSAHRLARYQAAQLAVVLPNPYRIQPVPMSGYVQRRVDWVLRQMRNLGQVSL